jgi:hypothetical protein
MLKTRAIAVHLWRALLLGIAIGSIGTVLGQSARAQAPSWTFYTVDFPNFATVTSPLSVNAHGAVTGYFDDAAGNYHGYIGQLLADGSVTMMQLDVPGAVQTVAATINDHGALVGVYWDATGFQHGFMFDKGGFTTIDFPGAAQTKVFSFEFGKGLGSAAFGLNFSGDVVGEYATGDNVAHGFLLHRGQFSSIDIPGEQPTPGAETEATDQLLRGHHRRISPAAMQ